MPYLDINTGRSEWLGCPTRKLWGLGGHLATITSLEENQFINSYPGLGLDTGALQAWIGASDVTVEGTWVWKQGCERDQVLWRGGAAVGYNAWSPAANGGVAAPEGGPVPCFREDPGRGCPSSSNGCGPQCPSVGCGVATDSCNNYANSDPQGLQRMICDCVGGGLSALTFSGSHASCAAAGGGEYVCTCANGVTAASAAACVWISGVNPCDVGQTCTDPNTAANS
eukprot:gene53792-21433_t